MNVTYSVKLAKAAWIIFVLFSGRTALGWENENIPSYVGLIGMLGLLTVLLIEKRNFHMTITSYYLLIALFMLLLLAGNLINVNDYGVMKTMEFFIYVLLFIVMLDVSLDSEYDYKALSQLLFLLPLIMACGSLFIAFINGTLLSDRLTFFGSGPNTFSRILMVGYVVNVLFLLNRLSLLKILSLWVLIAAIFFTGARQTMLGVIIFTVLFVFLHTAHKKKSKLNMIWKYLLLVAVLSLPIFYLWPRIEQSLFFQRFMLLFEDDKGDSIDVRTWLINQAIDMGVQSPLLGNGTGSFNSLFPEYTYPHNIFAEIFAENGVAGLTIILLLCMLPIVKYVVTVRTIKRDTAQATLTAYLIIYLFSLYSAQISGDLFDNRWVFIFGFVLITMSNSIKNKEFVHIPIVKGEEGSR